ncbi:MAG: plastocyanin/azurin family copper-binding protein [Balneolaceae bacterium]|nr:plastocyanin/azurin family copper-binding protein [Balneolaceae bacterium]
MLSACGTEADPGSEKLFDSGNIAVGESFSFTFQEEGTVEYYCEIHAPNMQGTVEVVAGASSTDPDTVEMMNDQFNPEQITVSPSTEIVWINRGSESHTVISGNPSTGNGDIY